MIILSGNDLAADYPRGRQIQSGESVKAMSVQGSVYLWAKAADQPLAWTADKDYTVVKSVPGNDFIYDWVELEPV